MSNTSRYPKRLIEVDLPIRWISEHARREKSIRHGHISTLHIWWVRRPLAACRAVICAALWPDPADPLCPEAFRVKARDDMLAWTSHERQRLLGQESCKRFEAAQLKPKRFEDGEELRGALLDFIADFANWDNSTVTEYLETSRALTQSTHEALGGEPGTRPLVVDPFAGDGSIPLEALRVGPDAFASDVNPIPGKEALKMIFEGADATGFEEDARLTAMWLWTISTAKNRDDLGSRVTTAMNPDEDDDEAAGSRKAPRLKGYTLEFDAARKIAQGLGAHLEHLDRLVEVKGETARLLPVEDRSLFLFGKDARRADSAKAAPRKKQMGLFAEDAALRDEPETWSDFGESRPGHTVLDRVHQAMLLHAAGRSVALKRFLVADGAGSDERFWRLAQALSALYPSASDEKRWVDGVLARKKGLGF